MKGRGQSRSKISTSQNEYIYTDIQIRLSDEAMKNMLSRVYEKAYVDANSFKFSRHFGVFITLAFTFLVTLLTSNFKQFFFLSAKVVEICFLVLCVGSFFLGMILCIVYFAKKDSCPREKRDKTVEKAIRELKNRCEQRECLGIPLET